MYYQNVNLGGHVIKKSILTMVVYTVEKTWDSTFFSSEPLLSNLILM